MAKSKNKDINTSPTPTPNISKINHDTVLPEHIVNGLIISLGPKEVFWKSDSRNIELNAFSGNISKELKKDSLTGPEVNSVLNGIRSGRIIVTNKVENTIPVNTKWLCSEYAPRARKLLDMKGEAFINAVRRTYSLNVLEAAIELEKEGKNREDKIKTISDKLNEMTKG